MNVIYVRQHFQTIKNQVKYHYHVAIYVKKNGVVLNVKKNIEKRTPLKRRNVLYVEKILDVRNVLQNIVQLTVEIHLKEYIN